MRHRYNRVFTERRDELVQSLLSNPADTPLVAIYYNVVPTLMHKYVMSHEMYILAFRSGSTFQNPFLFEKFG